MYFDYVYVICIPIVKIISGLFTEECGEKNQK